jgi:hypothetical protein
MDMLRLSALRIDYLYPQEISLEAENYANENSSDNIGEWPRDLPACREVPQPTEPLRNPTITCWKWYTYNSDRYDGF